MGNDAHFKCKLPFQTSASSVAPYFHIATTNHERTNERASREQADESVIARLSTTAGLRGPVAVSHFWSRRCRLRSFTEQTRIVNTHHTHFRRTRSTEHSSLREMSTREEVMLPPPPSGDTTKHQEASNGFESVLDEHDRDVVVVAVDGSKQSDDAFACELLIVYRASGAYLLFWT